MTIERTVVVTGGASGVGKATAKRLATQNWDIVLVDLNEELLVSTTEELRASGATVLGTVAGDVSDPSTAERAVELGQSEGHDLDGLVNSAGIVTIGTVPDLTIEEWDRIFAVNVRGTFLMMKAALEQMVPRGRGIICNVASVDGLVTEPNLVSYCSSKGAVVQLTRGAAVDHAGVGIRINCVCPGAIDTPFFHSVVDPLPNAAELIKGVKRRHPFNRLLHPDDVAAGIEFLFSDQASAMVGSAMVIDGGLTATWGAVSQ